MNSSKDEQESRMAGSSKQMTQLQIQVAELKEALQSETQAKLATQLKFRENESHREQLFEQIESDQDARKLLEKNFVTLQQQVFLSHSNNR